MNIFSICLLFYAVTGFANVVFMRELGGAKQIWMASDEGRNPKAVTDSNEWHLYPSIDSEGARVVYVRGDQKNTEIVVRTLSSGAETVIAPKQGLQLHPDFSGDGRLVAFSSPLGTDGLPQIVLVNSLKEEAPRVIKQDFACYFPRLSSDASFVVFQRDRSKENREIVLMDLVSGLERMIGSSSAKNMAPAISQDDRLIAYTAMAAGRWDVWVFDRIKGTTRQITRSGQFNFAPTFRRDGSIVYASDRLGHFALFRVAKEAWEAAPSDGELFLNLEGDLYAPSFSGDQALTLETMPDIPKPGRSSFGAIRQERNLYLIGGHQGPEHTYPESSFLDRVDIYDLDSGKWREGAPRKSKSHGFALTTFGKYIYAFGGFAYALPDQKFLPKWRSLDIIERYDTEKNSWETVGNMARRRSSYVVSVVDDKAYLIGGWDSTPRFDKDYDGTFHRAIDIFDFATQTISAAPYDLPDPLRRAFTAVTYHDEILLVGGLGQGGTHFELLDRVTALNPRTGTFRELAPLTFPTFAPAAGILDNSLFVFGGMFKTAAKEYVYVNHLFEMDLTRNRWEHTGRHLREVKGFAQVVDWDSSLVVLGGHSYENGVDAPVPTVDRLTALRKRP